MALDESIDGLEKLESNGIQAYIDPKLREFLIQFGSINIDFVIHNEAGGFTIRAGSPDSSCSSCGGTC